jgi:MATE family multidrug resistance protein
LTRNKEILQLAFPIILGNISQMALGLIDAAMVGQVGAKSLAASSFVLAVLAIPFVLGIGLSTAIGPLVAEARGAENNERVGKIAWIGFLLTCLVSGILVIGTELASELVFHLDQDPEVAQLAHPFFRLLNASLFPMLLFLALKQFADGLEFTKFAMTLSLLSIPINAFLNWIFIYGNLGSPAMGLEGAGWGTLITRCIILILMMLFIWFHSKFAPFKTYFFTRIRDREISKAILKIGIPAGLQYVVEAGAFSISGIMVGWISHEAQAAHQIALSLASTTFMISIGLSIAGGIKVAEALGRHDVIDLKNINKKVIHMSIIWGILCAVFFIVFKEHLPQWFTQDKAVMHIGSGLLILAAIFQISDSVQANAMGLLRGRQEVKFPTLFVIFAYWVIAIPLGYYLGFSQKMGVEGIWIGLVIGLTIAAIGLTWKTLNYQQNPKT